MKEATGEVSMTVIVIVAVAVIGGILAMMWPKIQSTIEGSFSATCPKGYTQNTKTGNCDPVTNNSGTIKPGRVTK